MINLPSFLKQPFVSAFTFLLLCLFVSANSQTVHLAKDNESCLYGFQNENNKWAIRPQFEEASHFEKNISIVSKGGKYGIISEEGKILINPKYDQLYRSQCNSPQFNNHFIVKQNGKYGLIDGQDHIRIPAIYDEIENCYSYSYNLISLRQGTCWGLADTLGLVVPPRFQSIHFDSHTGYYRVSNSTGWGLINQKGETIITENFKTIEPSHRCRSIWVKNDSSNWGMFNAAGKQIIPTEYKVDREWRISDGSSDFHVLIDKNGLHGAVNCEGKWITEPAFDQIILSEYSSQGKYMLVRKNKKWGLMNTSGDWVLPLDFDLANNGFAYGNDQAMMRNGKLEIYDAPDYTRPVEFKNHSEFGPPGFYYCLGVNQCGVFASDGKILIKPEYKSAEGMGDVIALLNKENSLYMFDLIKQKFILRNLPVKHFEIVNSDKALISTLTERTGVINSRAEMEVDTIYNVLSTPAGHGLWPVKKGTITVEEKINNPGGWKNYFHGNWGLIDTNGKFILDTIYDDPPQITDTVIVARRNNKMRFFSMNGTQIGRAHV